MHILREAAALLLILVNIWLVPSALGRVLFRPSNGVSDPFTTDEGTGILLKQHSEPLHLRNVTGLHLPEDNVFPILTPNRIFRRAPKQPPPATDDELASSAAKGCSMLYMLAANADDALTRIEDESETKDLAELAEHMDQRRGVEAVRMDGEEGPGELGLYGGQRCDGRACH